MSNMIPTPVVATMSAIPQPISLPPNVIHNPDTLSNGLPGPGAVQQNRPRRKSGVPCVSPRGDQWEVRAKLDGNTHYIGKFPTVDAAKAAKEAFLRGDPVERPSQSKSGATGVRPKGDKFQVDVMLKGKRTHLGRFPTLEAATAARAAFLRGEEVIKPEWDKPSCKSGVTGVYQRKEKFEAQVKQGGKAHYIGTFPSLEAASAARDAFLRGETVINPSAKRKTESSADEAGVSLSMSQSSIGPDGLPRRKKQKKMKEGDSPMDMVGSVMPMNLVPAAIPGHHPHSSVMPMATSMASAMHSMVPISAPDATHLHLASVVGAGIIGDGSL